MLSSHLRLGVARRTERDKVSEFVGHVNNQVVSARLQMMNVERASALAALSATPATSLITSDDQRPDGLPATTMLHPFSTLVVRVERADHRIRGAGVRAKAPPALDLAKKRAIWGAARFTSQGLGCDECGIAAPEGACLLPRVNRVELTAADLTHTSSPIIRLPREVALVRTESQRGGLFDDMVRPLEAGRALRAGVDLGAYLSGVLARLTTQIDLPIVGSELSAALGANLEHR